MLSHWKIVSSFAATDASLTYSLFAARHGCLPSRGKFQFAMMLGTKCPKTNVLLPFKPRMATINEQTLDN
jgi:hypothetical protein